MRTPRANLESLYGGGPLGSPYMYEREDPAKLLEETATGRATRRGSR